MPKFQFYIPSDIEGSEPITFDLKEGDSAFVLGANGSGKSSLMHLLYRYHRKKSVRISAHRQTWFTSDEVRAASAKKTAV